MPSKVQLYAQMADRTAEQITGSYQKWTAFLTTAARLYKYPYNEQLMIFAQRPEATACAEYDLWNKQMRRYVRRGSKGIALVDTSSDQPKLRYVFDVSDTSDGENSRRPYLWEYRQEHREVVSAALEQRFDVSGESGLADQLERVAAQLVDEYWHDNRRDIVGIVDGSFLEDYDEFNIGAAFRNAAVVSTAYALLSRCGMQPGDYFEHEDFLNVFDFNTPQTVAALGTAISQSSELVLRQIEVTIKNYEREKIAERIESHERTDLHPQRGLSDSRPEPDRAAASPAGQVRQDAEGLDEHGKWLPKARKVYDLGENGERIRLPSGNWKCHKENTVDWNDQKYAEVWRHSWETITNRYLEAAGRPERVDLRSFERQGIQQIPTVHLGPAAHQMEKRGVETFLGNLNRDIRAANSLMQSIRSAIRGLQRWIADLNEKKQLLLDALEKAKEPTLSDLLVDYFNLRNEQRSDWSGKAKLKCTVRDFEEVKRAVDYLKAHSLNTIEDLDTAISNLNQTAAPLRKQLKQNENRMRAIAQIKDAAAVNAKLKPIHDTFMKKNFKLTKDAYAAQHKEELDTFNKAVRTLMKLNGSTAVDFSALDAEFSALQSSSAKLRTQLETLQPDVSALKNIRKYIDMVLNKQQLSAPGGKMPEKESVLKKLEEVKAVQSQKKTEAKNHTQEL